MVDDLGAAEVAVLGLGATKHGHQLGTCFRVFLDPAGGGSTRCASGVIHLETSPQRPQASRVTPQSTCHRRSTTAEQLSDPGAGGGGRYLWDLFAREINAVSDPSVPVLSMVLITIGALVLANLVAAVPGRIAARTQTALLLQTE